MEWLKRLAFVREFSHEVTRRCRRDGTCRPVIRITDVPPSSGMLGWIDGAARTVLEAIEFRVHPE